MLPYFGKQDFLIFVLGQAADELGLPSQNINADTLRTKNYLNGRLNYQADRFVSGDLSSAWRKNGENSDRKKSMKEED